MTYDPYSPRKISGKDAAGDQGETPDDDPPRRVHGDAIANELAKRLLSVIERIERLIEEKAEIGEDIKTILAEGKGFGVDPKITRKLIRLRKQDAAERYEERSMLHAYMDALGMDYHGKDEA